MLIREFIVRNCWCHMDCDIVGVLFGVVTSVHSLRLRNKSLWQLSILAKWNFDIRRAGGPWTGLGREMWNVKCWVICLESLLCLIYGCVLLVPCVSWIAMLWIARLCVSALLLCVRCCSLFFVFFVTCHVTCLRWCITWVGCVSAWHIIIDVFISFQFYVVS